MAVFFKWHARGREFDSHRLHFISLCNTNSYKGFFCKKFGRKSFYDFFYDFLGVLGINQSVCPESAHLLFCSVTVRFRGLQSLPG